MWYGLRYALLLLADNVLFAWHGYRPTAWLCQFMAHRFASPMRSGSSTPSLQDLQALRAAQVLYPDRTIYLALGSEYSPWFGTRFFHEVKVLVRDSSSAHPGDCYGISLARFVQTQSSRQQTDEVAVRLLEPSDRGVVREL